MPERAMLQAARSRQLRVLEIMRESQRRSLTHRALNDTRNLLEDVPFALRMSPPRTTFALERIEDALYAINRSQREIAEIQ